MFNPKSCGKCLINYFCLTTTNYSLLPHSIISITGCSWLLAFMSSVIHLFLLIKHQVIREPRALARWKQRPRLHGQGSSKALAYRSKAPRARLVEDFRASVPNARCYSSKRMLNVLRVCFPQVFPAKYVERRHPRPKCQIAKCWMQCWICVY